jgi:Domain of unknown function (DUF4386)
VRGGEDANTLACDWPMSADERLLYEARVRPRQSWLAGIASVGLVGAAVLQLLGPHAKVSELTLGLINEHKRFGLDIASSVVQAFGWLGLAATLVFLFDSARAREVQKFGFIRIIAIVGGILAAVAGVASAVVISIKANDFVSSGAQTYEQAHALTSSASLVAPQIAAQAAALLMAVAVVLVCLQAMRVGLLTKFLGYLGMFAGVLVILPVVQLPIVQGYWLAALAYLFSGRWPSGVPPAWRSGRAEPWPSGAALREQRQQAAAARRGRGRGKPEPAPAPAPTVVRGSGASPAKRKRKRRR